jgi:hypothetical protein
MADSAKIREAAKAAMESQGFDPDVSEWEPHDELQQPGADQGLGAEETEEPSEAENVEDEGVLSPNGEADEASEDDGDTEEDDGSLEEVRTEYFGVDLSDIEPAKRAELLDKWREQDKFVQSVMRRNAELENQDPPAATDDEPEAPLSDEEFLASLGITEDDEMYEVKKEILGPVAKIVIQQQQQMQEMVLQQQAAAFLDNWDTTLNQLEEQYGELPMSHDDLLDAALENGIMDPVDAYNRVSMTGRKVVSDEVAKAKAAAARKAKKAASQPRPRNTSTEDTSKVGAKLDPKAAAKAAAETLGFDWGSALKSANRG